MSAYPMSDTDEFYTGIISDTGNFDYASYDPNVIGETPGGDPAKSDARGASGSAGAIHLAWLIVTGAVVLLVLLAVVFKTANN